jgi:hypothetical protein
LFRVAAAKRSVEKVVLAWGLFTRKTILAKKCVSSDRILRRPTKMETL